MNRKELIGALSEKLGVTKVKAEETLNGFLEVFEETLVAGEEIGLVGFGKFEVKVKEARVGRNPKTGESINIPAKKVVKFKAGKGLLDKVNE